jgi:hypothetical protein
MWNLVKHLPCLPLTFSIDSSIESTNPPKATESSAPSVSAAPRSPGPRGPRRKQYGTQPTRLEAADDPLGPLGAPVPPPAPEAPPAPPQKEQTVSRASQPPSAASTSSIRTMMDSVNLDDDDDTVPVSRGPRVPPPVQPTANDVPQRHTQPSVSVEQAAKPSFNISVGDPHKVGDLTSSHTEYSVSTKVCIFPAYPSSLSSNTIRRRRKGIVTPNSPSLGAIATFSGYTIRCTTTTPAS